MRARVHKAGAGISTRAARAVAIGALVLVVVVTAVILTSGDSRYLVHVKLLNAGGLRAGFKVRIDGVPVGSVTNVTLGRSDLVTADARIDRSAAPIGRDARATVRALNLLGEKYLDINPGDRRDPAPSGATIPVARTGQSVELDDIIDTMDPPTRAALNVVLDEGGRSLQGRGLDLAAALSALPNSLSSATTLLAQLSADNHSLRDMVVHSDRVLSAIVGQRHMLGQLVGGAATTLDAVAARDQQLRSTIAAAPATVAALHQALDALQAAAAPLGPAARGLQATAPALIGTLRALPPVAAAAEPALRAARGIAPSLDRLGSIGSPIAARLLPLARQLVVFARGINPATAALSTNWPDLLGVIEAWARATAGRDAAGHVFRLAVGGGADLLSALAQAAAPAPAPTVKQRRAAGPSAKPPAPSLGGILNTILQPPPAGTKKLHLPTITIPRVSIPGAPAPVNQLVGSTTDRLNKLLNYLLGK